MPRLLFSRDSPILCFDFPCFVILSAVFFCAKDLRSWAEPPKPVKSIAVLPKRDITLSSLQRASALVGRRVAIDLV